MKTVWHDSAAEECLKHISFMYDDMKGDHHNLIRDVQLAIIRMKDGEHDAALSILEYAIEERDVRNIID